MRDIRDSRTRDLKFALREKKFCNTRHGSSASVCKKRGYGFRAREKREKRTRGQPRRLEENKQK